MTWDYRIMRHTEDDPADNWVAIHEVYYKDGEVISWATDPSIVIAGDSEPISDEVARFVEALGKEVVDYELPRGVKPQP